MVWTLLILRVSNSKDKCSTATSLTVCYSWHRRWSTAWRLWRVEASSSRTFPFTTLQEISSSSENRLVPRLVSLFVFFVSFFKSYFYYYYFIVLVSCFGKRNENHSETKCNTTVCPIPSYSCCCISLRVSPNFERVDKKIPSVLIGVSMRV